MRPSPRSTRAKKPTTPTSPRRRPRVGDVVDVFWDDRQVYFRGRLVKRYYPYTFGFYIRYDDGDYISTDLNCFMWHYATDSNALMPSCCENPDDFKEGQLEELWGRGGEAGERKAKPGSAQSETTATPGGVDDEAQEEGMQENDLVRADHEGEYDDGCDVDSNDDLEGEEEQIEAGTKMVTNKMKEVGASGIQDMREEVECEKAANSSEAVPCSPGEGQVTGELVRIRSAISASRETVGGTDAERMAGKKEMEVVESVGKGPSWDNAMRRRKISGVKKGQRLSGEESPTASCQSLTTAEGFCLLDDLRRAKQRMRTSKKRALREGKSNLRRNSSEAGMSSEGHWKRRLRRRYFREQQE